MTNRTLRKEARSRSHREMMAAFTAFLDEHWQLWRQHQGEPRYNDMLAAFKAGWLSA